MTRNRQHRSHMKHQVQVKAYTLNICIKMHCRMPARCSSKLCCKQSNDVFSPCGNWTQGPVHRRFGNNDPALPQRGELLPREQTRCLSHRSRSRRTGRHIFGKSPETPERRSLFIFRTRILPLGNLHVVSFALRPLGTKRAKWARSPMR